MTILRLEPLERVTLCARCAHQRAEHVDARYGPRRGNGDTVHRAGPCKTCGCPAYLDPDR